MSKIFAPASLKPWRLTSVDLSTDSTTVYTGACFIKEIHVSVGLSAHLTLIKDDTTTYFGLPASAAAGANYQYGGEVGVPFATSLIIDPDNSGTGTITVVWRPAV